ncbi:hypothetical protein M947_10825 [Sulfurimonas hongkongensis]|uniref:GGDEF domain-containing protein n=1 Tax=Sulfurimonas hongkongensis TaxID=1172190 RepID=T0JCC4_9BACT|nr:GGDEF domain-containing protein [Sulfurimonas hongkongensis]EQB34492.1 hypothetical protein M947_10825 [Sulfurimonas hongkongensis]
MKHSINKIFSNFSMFLILSTLLVLILTLLIIEQKTSFTKIDILQNQKSIINSLKALKKDDIELALIQFNGKSNQLQHEIKKLQNLDKYNYVGKYLSNNSDEFLKDLDKLSKLTMNLNESAHNYYTKNLLDEEQESQKLKNAFDSINNFLDSMTIKNIAYAKDKHLLIEKVAFISLALLLFTSFWYRRRLKSIYKDILSLYAIDKGQNDYEVFSQEADAIQLRMKRKPVVTNNPSLKDPLTEINNYKGMINSYNQKKRIKDNNFTSVSIFEIDNFSKSKRTFSQLFTQTILKKVAFTISLHEQATDVIARTDYNQFTIILSRASKEASFKDIDTIRQSISEIKFKEPSGEPLAVTVSGGFVIKPNNQALEDSIKKAKEVLFHAQKKKNTISQIKDLAEHEF